MLRLEGSSALQEEWTALVRARWAGHRAAASEGGGDSGVWLDGDAAETIACDAAMAPIVTGDVNPGVLDDLVRLCLELDRHRHAGTPDTSAAWEALERAVIGTAVDLLSGPGGLASFLRRRQLGARLGGPSLPLDIRLQRDHPRRHPQRGHLAGPALPVGRPVRPARRGLPGAPHCQLCTSMSAYRSGVRTPCSPS